MSTTSKHPRWGDFIDDWRLLRVAYEGERAVKAQGVTYLKPTSGMLADGMSSPGQAGYEAYQAYKQRAVFPEFMAESVSTNMGMLWYKNPVIKLPKMLEPLMDRASVKGESMLQLLRRVHEAQLTTGRCGLLLDLPRQVPKDVALLPYIAMYDAEKVINWDDGSMGSPTLQTLNLVVLDETEQVREGFTWAERGKFRILYLGNPDTNETIGEYSVEVRDQGDGIAEVRVKPLFMGKALDEIPFVFVNSKDLLPEPDKAPLLPLANLCMTIYRGEADYRQNLFMQGQDTLAIIGAEGETAEGKETRVGSGAILHLPTGADAKYIGVNSKGLAEQRAALENDRRLAASRSGQLVDTTSRQRESGDALQTRVAAQTATLSDIALTAAGGLEKILKVAAKWVGADPSEVSVVPNLDFVNVQMSSRNIVELQTAKGLGAPISQETIHDIMRQRQLTTKTFEEELAAIKKEEPLVEPPPAPGSEGGQNGNGSGPGAKKQAGSQAGSGRGTAGV